MEPVFAALGLTVAIGGLTAAVIYFAKNSRAAKEQRQKNAQKGALLRDRMLSDQFRKEPRVPYAGHVPPRPIPAPAAPPRVRAFSEPRRSATSDSGTGEPYPGYFANLATASYPSSPTYSSSCSSDSSSSSSGGDSSGGGGGD